MGRKRRTEPRKLPTQERSRETVDAIVVAAERVLQERGLDGLTTARVAEVAGVSVGTLYQYFPSKQAILAILIERNNLEVLALVRRLVDATRTVPLAEALPMLSRGLLLHFHSARARLQGPLIDARGGAERIEVFRAHLASLVALCAEALEERNAELRITDFEAAAFFIVHTADGIAQAMGHELPEASRTDRIAAQVTDALTRYLLR